jgi:hypothetical protein
MADTHLATVADLIAHLQKFPPETLVFIDGDDDELLRVGRCHHWSVRQADAETWYETEKLEGDKALILSHYSP